MIATMTGPFKHTANNSAKWEEEEQMYNMYPIFLLSALQEVRLSIAPQYLRCKTSPSHWLEAGHIAKLYHGLAIYREVTFLNVTSVAENTE